MNMLNACTLESQKAAKITACFFFLMLHFFNTDMRDKYTTAMQLERVSLRIVIVGVCDMYTKYLYQKLDVSYIYFLKLSNYCWEHIFIFNLSLA